MTNPNPLPGEQLNVLEQTLQEHRDRIGLWLYALELFGWGSEGMRRRLETAASFRPEKIFAVAQLFQDLSRAYAELRDSAQAIGIEIDSYWDGEGVTSFLNFFNLLTDHIAGDNYSLSAIATHTANTMNGFGQAIMAWQMAVSQAIQAWNAHNEEEERNLLDSIYSAPTADPLVLAGNIARVVDRAIRAAHDSAEEEAQFWMGEFMAALNIPAPSGGHLQTNFFDGPTLEVRMP